MKKTFTLAMALCGLALAPCEMNAERVIVTTFNSANVILPSSEYRISGFFRWAEDES